MQEAINVVYIKSTGPAIPNASTAVFFKKKIIISFIKIKIAEYLCY